MVSITSFSEFMLISPVHKYIYSLTLGINAAMSKAYRRDPSSPRSQFVAHIVLCKGIPFYGYHVGYSYFLKIYLLSPYYLNKLADLLRNGGVMGRAIQPYEAHIPYLLQFFTDFNLTGCGNMSVNQGWFRAPLPLENEISEASVSADSVLDPSSFRRMSHCELEMDIDASAIQNRYSLKQRNLHNNFSEMEAVEPQDALFIPSLVGIWTDEANRRHDEGMSSFQPPVELTQREVGEPPWRRMKELKQALDKLLKDDDSELTTEFPEDNIPTTFETVDTMFRHFQRTPAAKHKSILEEPEHGQPLSPLSDISDGDTESTTFSKTEDDVDVRLDPLSQMLNEVESPEVSSEDPFGSLTDSMILNETSVNNVRAVITNNSVSERLVLSQGQSPKRELPHGSQASPLSKKHSFSLPGRGVPEFGNSLETELMSNSPSQLIHSSRFGTGDIMQRRFVNKIAKSFNSKGRVYVAQSRPPTSTEVMNSLEALGLPGKIYKQPYFSNPKDVPAKPAVFAGVEFRLKSNQVDDLPTFSFSNKFASVTQKLSLHPLNFNNRQLMYAKRPPSAKAVRRWCQTQRTQQRAKHTVQASQIRGPTQKAEYDFKYATQKKLTSRKTEGSRYLSVMVAEVHVNTRGELHPDTEKDEIVAVFWAFQSADSDEWDKEQECGAIFVCTDEEAKKRYQSACKFEIEAASSELDVFNMLVDVVRRYDPDILAGYEVNSSSWGYIIGRGKKAYDIDMCNMLSRVKDLGHGNVGDKWGSTHTSAINITGRHVFNVWRILRNEVNLLKYSLENVVYHTIHHRLPFYSYKTLTDWFLGPSATDCALSIRYHFDRVLYAIKIINTQELISRTSEQARIVGIDFYSVFYRGSQYKIEAIMTRLSKAENYVLISPSRKQVGEQNALECLPLIMEPQSKLYTSPVVVLDFQSLYPSIMIAYNYCYSTCLGRLQNWRGRNKLGFTNYKMPAGLLKLLENEINIAPNGIIYAKRNVRRSLLAKMLTEILDTRVMIKDGMKSNKDNSSFQRLMNNRQLALKLIANVTYGYTSASYSGRMPCVEIADSIVQSARETLEKAIDTIKSTPQWGAEIVYGDTDSLFLHFPGKTKDQAFDLGNEIARAVTNMNPQPVRLKFEKVYLPCILQTKKRYVGHAYEYKTQKEPKFDAKGMETVRRDGTPAQQKMEEKALEILFRTVDLSQVKSYFEEQWTKIMCGNVSIQDFCFAKEVKIGTYRGLAPPGAMIASEKIKIDANAAPQYRERVPYVVIAGAPGERLVDRCVAPEVLVNNSAIHLDSEYYITKNLIPPLERIFNLVGANVRLWYEEMPKVHKFHQPLNKAVGGAGSTTSRKRNMNLRHYLKDSHCRVCLTSSTTHDGNSNLTDGMCTDCRAHLFEACYTLTRRMRKREKKLIELNQICQNCAAISPSSPVQCVSLDCPIYYSRKRAAVFYEETLHDMKLVENVDW